MKAFSFTRHAPGFAAFLLAIVLGPSVSLRSLAQQNYKLTSAELKVTGSSTLHDWEMKATTFACEGNFVVNNRLRDIKALEFSLPVTNLKSKESLMDKRAYKVLKADENPRIGFRLISADITGPQMEVTGNLSIAGVTRPVTMAVNYAVNADQAVVVKGSRKIRLSDFQIAQPSFMLGALKVGNEVTVEFNLTLSGTGTQLTSK
jgi:polyisoprenoid-binding protein YceI